ncbi:hypothetical protein [Acidianus sp. HS-5]|uniref:hypothetical protein n=1 Tax=Acidianus sp. HS-5 TaxID=2886040 RepID=UPI001F36573B|nr:hypothetical protein [Acidianus sp. HS-5]BDC18775.1 hypothetical protein HS5_16650 [Acidianus sp. HS-5]
MANKYEKNYVMLYSKVRNNPDMKMYLERTLGTALQFVTNELISFVILDKSKTALMLYEKYKSQGLSSNIILEITAITVNILKDNLPELAKSIGNVMLCCTLQFS